MKPAERTFWVPLFLGWASTGCGVYYPYYFDGSPMLHLSSGRVHTGWYVQGIYHARPIQDHGGLGRSVNVSLDYDSVADGVYCRVGYGWSGKTKGLEVGFQAGFHEFHWWEFQVGSDQYYYPAAIESISETFQMDPYVRVVFRPRPRLRLALTVEWLGAAASASYEVGRFRPYVVAKWAGLREEAPIFEWSGEFYYPFRTNTRWLLVPLVGLEVDLSRRLSGVLEGGWIPDYFRKDDLYILSFSLVWD